MFKIFCQKCEHPLTVTQEQCGRDYHCPNCGALEVVPLFESLKDKMQSDLPPVPGSKANDEQQKEKLDPKNNLPPVPTKPKSSEASLPPVPNPQDNSPQKVSPDLPPVPGQPGRERMSLAKKLTRAPLESELPPVPNSAGNDARKLPAIPNSNKGALPPVPNSPLRSTQEVSPHLAYSPPKQSPSPSFMLGVIAIILGVIGILLFKVYKDQNSAKPVTTTQPSIVERPKVSRSSNKSHRRIQCGSCKGRGVEARHAARGSLQGFFDQNSSPKKCSVCNGRGWISGDHVDRQMKKFNELKEELSRGAAKSRN